MDPAPKPAADAPLPDDVAALKALLLAERASAARLAGHNEQLRALVRELQRALFGRRSEKAADPDQLQLALEDRSRRKRWRASARSSASSTRSAAGRPSSAAACAWRRPGR